MQLFFRHAKQITEMSTAAIHHRTKPFVKWAGGKTQLIPVIEQILPSSFADQTSVTYIEPFVGGGAVLFHLLQKYQNISKAIINDINPHLIHTYQSIKEHPEELISKLSKIQILYKNLQNAEKQRDYFLAIREKFNKGNLSLIDDAAYMIFLNRTCFNGLYRENSKGAFNVAFGKYSNPTILDEDLIRADSNILQKVEILHGDFSQIEDFISGDYTFIYFDPPYRPISMTANFNAYTKGTFNDKEQFRLRNFYIKMNEFGCNVLLSNSDGTSIDPTNTYMDDLYQDFIIHRVSAKRSISCAGSKRGPVSELLIRNYKECQSEFRQIMVPTYI